MRYRPSFLPAVLLSSTGFQNLIPKNTAFVYASPPASTGSSHGNHHHRKSQQKRLATEKDDYLETETVRPPREEAEVDSEGDVVLTLTRQADEDSESENESESQGRGKDSRRQNDGNKQYNNESE